MNKAKHGRKFGRERDQRRALLMGLAQSLILHGKIQTSEAKAKELRPYIEKIITKSRTDSVSARRFLLSDFANNNEVVKKLISNIGPKYKARSGGYTRITKRMPRKTDATKMAVIELI